MAKEKENSKQISIMDAITNEKVGVEEVLGQSNAMDDEIRKMAEDKMKEEEKQEKAEELIRISKQAAWTNLRLRIEKNYTNKTDDLVGDALKKSLELLNALKTGEKDKKPYTPTMYMNDLNNLADETVKNIAKAGNKRRELLSELEKSYVGYYSFAWSNPFTRINRAIEDNRR